MTPEKSSQNRNWSFAELEAQENVSAEDLKLALRKYAESGSSISGRVVNSIIDRTDLSEKDIQEVIAIAQIGVDDHTRKAEEHLGEKQEAEEYQKVAD